MTCKTHDPYRPRTGKPGGKREEPNSWPRCLGACGNGQPGHRVPPSAIHAVCNRAADKGEFYLATATHGPPCCPGACPSCELCIDHLDGFCDRCLICLGCCPGHGADGEDETGGQ